MAVDRFLDTNILLYAYDLGAPKKGGSRWRLSKSPGGTTHARQQSFRCSRNSM
jgi:hypothetical protein